MERDPTKRKVKPAQALLDFEDLGESSDDSDFRIEDHCEDSDDDSIDSDDNDPDKNISEDSSASSDDNDNSDQEGSSKGKGDIPSADVLSEAQKRKQFDPKESLKIMICSVCLGDRSDATNEIIECDNCGVTVHEGCYGVQDNDSICSTDSPCPTTPWFCDACKAGVENLDCELCPNSGGIYKETDVGKWVHLVCALYMPGVAFAEVDRLSNVTLFEMSYTKWGSKACSLCQDQRFARTGVVVSCDAGMCRTYFHVTCGQREGLLSEAHSEEVDQADPFYAHCRAHSDKTLIRKRRRNWLALQMRSEQKSKSVKDNIEHHRILRRLDKYRTKYYNNKAGKPQPWVPTQKMPRLLTTSATACRQLWKKAELSGIDTQSWEMRQAQLEALTDIHRKWHIQPAFSVEFIGYYLDRNMRVISMRKQLAELLEENSKLLDEQSVVEEKRDKVVKSNTEELDKNKELRATLDVYYDVIRLLCPNKKLPNLDLMGLPPPQPASHPLAVSGGVPTPAALKAGVGFPIRTQIEAHKNKESLINCCGLCYGRNDQHLLAKCDTCKKYYHLGCLNPPLTRMPKKTKLMGWQCSECDKDSDDSDAECVDTEAPRKLRHKDNNNDSQDASSVEYKEAPVKLNKRRKSDTSVEFEQSQIPIVLPPESPTLEVRNQVQTVETLLSSRNAKKRRREKHHRYSPEPSGRPHKHKHKKAKQQEEQRQSLKICFKSIPHPTGEGSAYVATPSSSSFSNTRPSVEFTSTPLQSLQTPPQRLSSGGKKKEEAPSLCDTCKTVGTSANLVKCDECLKGFHFHCLDPPVKKSPKVRGYSWHCANCDPTESDE